MQFLLFPIIFVMCTMVLKTESSHNFKELGFSNFQNKNVHEYLKQQAPELREICQGTRKFYEWKLPISGGKILKFAQVVRKTEFPPIASFFQFSPRFNLFSQASWELVRINGKLNFDPNQEPTKTISFQIKKDLKEIFLKNLYPTFPKVSGVSILQFLMSLSYACGFTLSVKDESDISASYKMLYGSTYYETLIKGMGNKTTLNQNKTILKKDFYKCANFELERIHPVYRMKETLNSCQEKNLSVHDCPVHFLWLGNVIHYTFIPKCGLNFQYGEWIPQPLHEFIIIPKDLIRIFNIILPKLKPALYPLIMNCTPKRKHYENFKKDVFSLKFFKNAFDFCFLNSKFTILSLFQILRGCVTETLNFLWKNECYSNLNNSKV